MADKLPPMNLPGPAIPYMRALEKILTDVQNQQTRTNESLTNIRTSAQRAGSAVDLASARLGDLSRTVTEIPLSPTGVHGTQRWDWDLQGHASSALDVSWDVVTHSGTGADVNVTTYQVWLREQNTVNPQRVLAVGALSAMVTGLKVNTGYYVSISAVSASGTMGGLSTEVYVAPPAPLAKLTPPTPPGLASDYGVVALGWDGLLTGPDPIPRYSSYVRAFIATSATGPWTAVGPNFVNAGSTTIANLPVDSTRYFKLVAYDRVGGNSDDSAVTSIVVKGVDLGTLNADLDQLQLDLAQNEQAVSNLAVAPIDGSRVLTGTLPGSKLAAADLTNAVSDPGFTEGTTGPWQWASGENRVAFDSTGGRAGGALKVFNTPGQGFVNVNNVHDIQVKPGELLYWEYWYKTTADAVPFAGLRINDGVSTELVIDNLPGTAQTAWTRRSGTFRISDGVTICKVRFDVGAGGGSLWVDDVAIYRTVNANLIEDGAVVSEKIAPNAVTAGQIAAGTITAREIGAGSILAGNIGAGQVLAQNIGAGQIQANHIAADSIDANKIKVGAIQASHLSPSVGGSIDISANNSVNLLIGSVNAANAAINSVDSTVDTMSTYYQFGPTGATISAPGSPFAVGVRNDRIDMLQQGVAVSSWNAGQMFVNSFVGSEVVLGNHKLEKYGNGTVVRAI